MSASSDPSLSTRGPYSWSQNQPNSWNYPYGEDWLPFCTGSSTLLFKTSTEIRDQFFLIFQFLLLRWGPCAMVANVLDSDILVNEFKLQLCYYIHIRTNTLGKGIWTPLSSLTIGWIVPLLSFYKDVFLVLNNPQKLMSLNKETKLDFQMMIS